jgi:dipeptidyl aminopeptidase/acylaminoacyl peptidase
VRLTGLLLAVLLVPVAACTGGGATPASDPAESRGSAATSPSAVTGPPAAAEPAPLRAQQRTTLRRRPHPVSLPALAARRFDGRGLRLVEEVLRADAYTQYAVTYRSGRLTISGIMNVPHGRGPWPALVLAHGYIDPAVYVSGQGLTRERDYLARAGYLTLHVDYRNHAGSSTDPAADRRLRLGYTEDVVNAVRALRRGPAYVDDDRIGLLGRSMGGGVVYNVLTVRPGLVDAAVVFAPVSSAAADNFERWVRPDPSRDGLARRILDDYGEPADNPEFWRAVSPRTYFDRVTEPLLIHHGTSDDSCPLRWSQQTVAALRREDKDVRLYVYEGEEHAFGPQWPLSMARTVDFLDRRLS